MMSVDRISRCTVNRVLLKYGLRSHRHVNKPFLTNRQRKKRIEWARKRKQWTTEDWYQVVFSDECMFHTHSHCERETTRRFDHERFSSICTNKTVLHGSQIHVWGCFSRYDVGLLKKIDSHLNSHKYQSEIISDIDIMGQCLVFPAK